MGIKHSLDGMKKFIKNTKKNLFIYLAFVFIGFYFLFIFLYYDLLLSIKFISSGYNIPIFIIIGFTIIIIIIFYFLLNINHYNNIRLLKLNILNERSIETILISLMLITYLIAPISFTESIIAWSEIGLLNYFRAVIFIIGCAYLPGMSIFNIAFPKSKLHERFHVEPFMIKITVYPLLSFSFLGVCTIILDNFGLKRVYFSHVLFLIIIILTISDIILKNKRSIEKLNKFKTEVIISKYSTLILLLAIGVIFITFGIRISSQYLIEGDSWRGIQYAYFVGDSSYNPFWGPGEYVKYWGYVSFSLGSFCGIPYLNANVMLFPFVYLFVFSIYLMVKALLHNLKQYYSILATILIVTYSGLFYPLNYEITIPSLISNGIFIFDYKGFSFIFFIMSLALFIIITKTSKNSKENKKLYLREEFPIIILAAFFLVQSCMIYFFPIIPGFFFIFIYAICYRRTNQVFKYAMIFWSIFITLFIISDTLCNGYLSYFVMNRLYYFSDISFFNKNRFNEYITYIFLLISLFFVFIIYSISNKLKPRKNLQGQINSSANHYSLNQITRYLICILSIIFILIIIISIEIEILFKKKNLTFLPFYFGQIFENIGFLGILGIITSYYCYKENRKLFYLMITLIILIIGFASILTLVNWVLYPTISVFELDYMKMNYWFNRIWHYSIIPLSILSSIGIIYMIKNIKLEKMKDLKIQKTIFTSVFIFLSLSNNILSSIYIYNRYYKYSEAHDETQMIGWVSENIPYNSNIVVEDSRYNHRLRDLSFCNIFNLHDEAKEAMRNGRRISDYLASKEIQYYIRRYDPYRLVGRIFQNKLYEYGTLAIYYTEISNYYSYCVDGAGIFNATYNFRCDTVGYPPEGWWVSSINETIIQVIDEIDGHKKVVEIEDKSEGYDKVKNEFGDKDSGTVELWIRTNNASKYFFIDLRDEEIWAARIYFSETYFNIYGNILCNATIDKWHHIRFDFRCTGSLPYMGLDEGTYDIWIDSVKRIEGVHLNLKAGKIDNLIFMSSFTDKNYIIHLDAIGYSWDPNYNIGMNLV